MQLFRFASFQKSLCDKDVNGLVDFASASTWKKSVWSKFARRSLPDPGLSVSCTRLIFPVLCLVFALSIPLCNKLSLCSPAQFSSDGSLRSFTSKGVCSPFFGFKDVAYIRQGPGNVPLSPCVCDSLGCEADRDEWGKNESWRGLTRWRLWMYHLILVRRGSDVHRPWLALQRAIVIVNIIACFSSHSS